jgi:hypothetical protein
MYRSTAAVALAALALGCAEQTTPTTARGEVAAAAAPAGAPAGAATAADDAPAPVTVPAGATDRVPNELGRIPVLEYHLLGDPESHWKVSTRRFRENLETLYARGYRP